MPGILYIVATPIGNSEDITDRAKRILREVDMIAAEDTRTTQKLLKMLEIHSKMISNHKFNERRQADTIIMELIQGKNVAIVSDAGTPCISDPGHEIVRKATEMGIEVIAVCGASAVITALSISGFSFTSFRFYGFFPRENKEIKEVLQDVLSKNISVSVFFESPKRVEKMLRILAEELPDSKICLCNDLTKLYEKIYRGAPSDVLDEIINNPFSEKGEYTLVLYSTKVHLLDSSTDDTESHEAMLIDYIVKNGGTLKDAIQNLQKKYKGQISKKEFYAAALNLKQLMPSLLTPGSD